MSNEQSKKVAANFLVFLIAVVIVTNILTAALTWWLTAQMLYNVKDTIFKCNGYIKKEGTTNKDGGQLYIQEETE